MNSTHNVFYALALLFALGLTDGSAHAQGACCQSDGSCTVVADVPECSALGGILLDGEDCSNGNCGSGACCDGDNCVNDIANAFQCETSGRTYGGAGTTCLDDPCNSNVGACCNNGACSDASPPSCAGSGGVWLGAGTNCGQTPCVIGVCCTPGACAEMAAYECAALDGTFTALITCADPDACLVEAGCPSNSLFAQERRGPNSFTAYTSEFGEFERSDNFSGIAGTIEGVTFWGFELEFQSPNFQVCTEAIPTFNVRFREDDNGLPGADVCNFTLAATRIDTGVSYDGLDLKEYRIDLPSPCVLTNGWITLVGEGNPNCWFLWINALGGDNFSHCSGCVSELEGADLAFCLTGTYGAAIGACCDFNSGVCMDDIAIQDCLTVGLEFTPDTDCANLDPLCFQAIGGCCFADGTCTEVGPSSCDVAGGDWLGPDTVCDDCPEIGACCFGELCTFERESDCDKIGGIWLGDATLCEDCPELPDCAPEALFSMPPDPVNVIASGIGVAGSTSEVSAGFQRYQAISGVAGSVASVRFWGFDLEFVPPATFLNCEELNTTFEISFHEDIAGVPGAAVCSYTVVATRTPTVFPYLGTLLNEYEATLPTPCVISDGWISIVGGGAEDCWFLWATSGVAGSYCDGCSSNFIDHGLAVCLGGTQGGVFGACCDDLTGTCMDNTEIVNCQGAGLRFEPDASCASLDPACGLAEGACCMNDGSCTISSAASCLLSGGSWLGSGTNCSQCPCQTPCPGTATAEGEPQCDNGYDDNFNGGCDADSTNFGFIDMGDEFCGTSGVFILDSSSTLDQDWWEAFIFTETEVAGLAIAEFPARLLIVDGNGGCLDAPVVAEATGDSCTPFSAQATLPSGIYWFGIRPQSFGDGTVCGARYTVSLGAPIDCPEDVNGTGVIDVDDLVAVILAWGTNNPAADINNDGTVNVDDLVAVILAWGPCPIALQAPGPAVDRDRGQFGFEVSANDGRAERLRVTPNATAEPSRRR